jgi:hypothetical protein
MAKDNDGQPSLEQLAREGVPLRKCIASGEQYGSGSAPKAAPKQKGALAGLKMGKGRGY